MSTNLQLITDSLRALGIIDENETPSAEQGVQGLRRLNQVLATWGETDLTFPSWFTQSTTTDTCPLPDWAELAVTYAVSIALAPDYGVAISGELASLAESTRAIVLRKRLNQKLQPVSLNMQSAEGDYYPGRILSG